MRLKKKCYIFYLQCNCPFYLRFNAVLFKKKLKVLFNIPYESYFNMVELCFRALKNHIYKNLYSSIKEMENDLVNLLNSETIKNQLPLLFKETLKEYIKFIKENINDNLNFI